MEQSEDELIQEIHRADVICVVFAVDDPSTLESVPLKWLPMIRSVLGPDHSTPVILVGNKSDLVIESTFKAASELMKEFSEIETCVECSARTLKNISEMFYYAQKAVLHPTAPLFEKSSLTEKAKRALTRIFKVLSLCEPVVLFEL
jgi:Ras family protein T1